MNNIFSALKQNTENYSDKTALVYRENDAYKSISHCQLYQYIKSLSAFLTPGYKNKNIAIIGNNKLEYLVSLLSVLGFVGNALMIDKELDGDDIRKIFEQAEPDLVLLDDEIDFLYSKCKIIKFSEVQSIIRQNSDFNADDDFCGNLILHTSGTTGEPKCIEFNEEQYYSVIPELNRKWNVTYEHSCLLIIPLYHIYALTSMFHSLYAGLPIILEYDYKRLGNVLSECRPFLFMGVPLMYNKIKDAFLSQNANKIKFFIRVSNILMFFKIDVRKRLFKKAHDYFGGNYYFGCSAGSLLSQETSRFFNDIGLPVYNVYGMTETCGPVAISYKGHNECNCAGEILEINSVELINTSADGSGEITVKGVNVFKGYVNDADKSYLSNGYFNTGDIGYVRDNHLFIIGRKKNILIRDNGKNISPEELNGKILKFSGINDCNVVIKNNMLTAVIDTDLSPEHVKRIISSVNEKLPGYKKIHDFEITHKKIK